MSSKMVNVDRCSCEKTVKAHNTMIEYDGVEEDFNSSISTCSKHSYSRGEKQRVQTYILYIHKLNRIISCRNEH